MSRPRRILPVGERALLAEVDGPDAVLALHAALAASAPAGVAELVPAARSVLVRFDPARVRAAAVRAWIAAAEPRPAARAAAAEVVLEVAYDGPDLAETARLLRLSPAGLAARHSRTPWQVAFTGFAPGFAYLVGDDWPFDVPRLEAPRTRVPAGAVGLAAGFTGAYPRETPGGWRLIGTTRAPLFDPGADVPVLLSPGTRVRVAPVRPAVTAAAAPPTPHDRDDFVHLRAIYGIDVHETGADVVTASAPPTLRVDAAGRATVQDLGRPGLAHLGVARSGALDRAALRLANRLVGNAEDAAGIEIAPGGFAATALRDTWVAVTGTWLPLAIVRASSPLAAAAPPLGAAPAAAEAHRAPVAAAPAAEAYRALLLRRGDRLEVGWPAQGARGYLAVRGGVDAPVALGSRATDTLAGLGAPTLRAGDLLAAGDAVAGPVPALDLSVWGWPPPQLDLTLRPGPRADWFAPAAHEALADAVWTVTPDADRVGIRLDGPSLPRLRPGELPSEGTVPGALQVPPAGRPVILLADGPVTGGYPVIAVVDDRDLDRLAQAVPGTGIRFRPHA